MERDAIPALPRGVRLHFDKVRDCQVLLAPERAIVLDGVGHAVLSEIDGIRSFGQITAELAAKYDAPEEQIVEDCRSFLQALCNRRFLDMREPAP